MLERHARAQEEELQLKHLVFDIRADHPTMGMRDMYHLLQPEGLGRDAFERLCRGWGFQSKPSRNLRRTTDSLGVVRFCNLIQQLTLVRINQLWQSDITYFEVLGRFFYLTFILDGFSRRILGHCASKRLYTEATTLPCLRGAIHTRRGHVLSGLILHSDGGGQYYDKEFLALTAQYEMQNSMCEYAWENGKAERINGVIKNNYLRHRNIKSFEELQRELDRAVLLYNTQKPHSALQKKPPVTFEQELLALAQQTKPKMTESLDAKHADFGGI